MKRGLIVSLALMASACSPAPTHMAATDASEWLARFASGAVNGDVCTPGGRATLRGAVRAYGAEMARAGVVWPTMPGASSATGVSSLDASVLVAFAAGFVETSDFYGPTRAMLGHLAFAQMPEVQGMRRAANIACNDVMQLQQAAATFVLETERYRDMEARRDARLARQQRRLERAQEHMSDVAALIEARLRDARS